MTLIDIKSVQAMMLTPVRNTLGHMVMGIVPAFEGPPGNAKSARIHKAIFDLGLHTTILRPASMGKSDIVGIPTPVELEYEPGKVAVFNERTLPMWARNTFKQPTCVFVEELTAGSDQQAMARLLGVIQDRKLDDFELSHETRFCTVYNPESCAVGGIPIDAPVSNRLVTIPVMYNKTTDSIPDVDVLRAGRAWAEWFVDADDDFSAPRTPDVEALRKREQVVKDAWRAEYASARALVLKFLADVPGGEGDRMVYHLPDPTDSGFSRGWRSFRSNETAARLIASAKIQNLGADQLQVLLRGTVGDQWVENFETFFVYRQLPNGREFLEGEWEKFDFTADVLGSKVVLDSALSYIKGTKDVHDRVDYMWVMGGVLERAISAGSDVVASVMRKMSENDMYHVPDEYIGDPKAPNLIRHKLYQVPELRKLIDSLNGRG